MNTYIATTQIPDSIAREYTLSIGGELECHSCKYATHLNKDNSIEYMCSFLSVFGRKVEITSYVLQHYDPRPDICPFKLMDGET